MRLLLPLVLVATIGLGTRIDAQPAPRARAASAAPATVTVTVTDGGGLPLQGVSVRAAGPVDREATSLASGLVRLLNMQPGQYRLRFSHDKFITLERDIVVRGGQPLALEVMLSPAQESAAAPAPTPPATPQPQTNDAPPGEPRNYSMVDYIERNFISGRDPVKEDTLGCTASTKTTLLQIRDPQPERAIQDADEVLYVVAGEGTLRLGNKDVPLTATTLAVVPRGTARGITRKGRNPLIVVSTLSGPPCTK